MCVGSARQGTSEALGRQSCVCEIVHSRRKVSGRCFCEFRGKANCCAVDLHNEQISGSDCLLFEERSFGSFSRSLLGLLGTALGAWLGKESSRQKWLDDDMLERSTPGRNV